MLWEFKGYMMPDKLVEKPSFDSFKGYIDERFVQNSNGERKGVAQLAHLIDLMAKGKTSWYRSTQPTKGGKKRGFFLC
ncbi:hypothetical protein ACQ86N_00115 [Puia sp. P3]|uniref:hypothetical protein n=1 Tax=Puia sp. P3 TaxID=3423952 RepID=UPI003D665583